MATTRGPAPLGLFELLPDEVLDVVLLNGGPRVWAVISSLSKQLNAKVKPYIDAQLKTENRLKTLTPGPGESRLSLYNYTECQHNAIAQATAIAFGGLHSAAIMIRGDDRHRDINGHTRYRLYSWGRGFYGQLGPPRHGTDTNAPIIANPRSVRMGFANFDDDNDEEIMPVAVSAGACHTAAITRRGDLFTWGMGTSGETGRGPLVCDTSYPKAASFAKNGYIESVRTVAVACGAQETFAIDEQGDLWVCGRNHSGQLGLDHRNASYYLVPLPAANFGSKAPAMVAVHAGAEHTVFLGRDGLPYTCGSPANGRLGLESMQRLAAAAHVPLGQLECVTKPRYVEMFHNQAGQPKPQKPLSTDVSVTYVTCGDAHTVVITHCGLLMAWGANKHGQLGIGCTEDQATPATVSIKLPAVKPVVDRALYASAGARHTAVLISHAGKTVLATCGCNHFGQLGHGDQELRTKLEQVAYFQKHRTEIATVVCGGHHTGLIDEDGGLYTWGRGDVGQLGTGELVGSWVPQRIKAFHVAHSNHTLHRAARPRPRLRPRLKADLKDLQTMTPTPHPQRYRRPCTLSADSRQQHGALDVLFQRHTARLRRSSSMPALPVSTTSDCATPDASSSPLLRRVDSTRGCAQGALSARRTAPPEPAADRVRDIVSPDCAGRSLGLRKELLVEAPVLPRTHVGMPARSAGAAPARSAEPPAGTAPEGVTRRVTRSLAAALAKQAASIPAPQSSNAWSAGKLGSKSGSAGAGEQAGPMAGRQQRSCASATGPGSLAAGASSSGMTGLSKGACGRVPPAGACAAPLANQENANAAAGRPACKRNRRAALTKKDVNAPGEPADSGSQPGKRAASARGPATRARASAPRGAL